MDRPDCRVLAEGMVPEEATPFGSVLVTLTKQEHIVLLWEASFYRMEQRLRLATEAAAQRQAQLRAELKLEQARARVHDLEHRLFGRKSERGRVIDGKHRHAAPRVRRRGQQPGSRGHGRRGSGTVPTRVEEIELESAQCPQCGEALMEFAGTDDCEVLEIEVRAYRRLIRRQKYRRRIGLSIGVSSASRSGSRRCWTSTSTAARPTARCRNWPNAAWRWPMARSPGVTSVNR